jgi:hypothetical protein
MKKGNKVKSDTVNRPNLTPGKEYLVTHIWNGLFTFNDDFGQNMVSSIESAFCLDGGKWDIIED